MTRLAIAEILFPDMPMEMYRILGGGSGSSARAAVTDSVTNGSLSTTSPKIRQSGSTYYSRVTVIPGAGYLLPETVTVTGTATSSTYDPQSGLITFVFPSDVLQTAEVTAACPAAIYTGAKLGRAILGTMILGTE